MDVETRLLTEGLTLPPLELETIRPSDEVGSRSDLLVRAEWQGQQHDFAVEGKGSLTPRMLRHLLHEIGGAGGAGQGRLRMIIAPYLGPKALALLADAEISGVDLSGN